MTPTEIQKEIKDNGLTQKEIARRIGVAEMCVSKVINKQMVSDRIMRGIAEAIGWDHRAVFPEYYFSHPKRSTSKVAVNE